LHTYFTGGSVTVNFLIRETCGVQYQETIIPSDCIVCSEERQYVNPNGQTWTTLEEMKQTNNYQNDIINEEPGLHSITTIPEFGIGQTAYLVQESGFNVLWDCIMYIDEETIKQINKLGGIQAIALSHPHYYSTQVEWSDAFDAPIYIHQDDKEWITRKSDKIKFWSGESLNLQDGLMLHRLGGHFKGGSVLEWRKGNNHKGFLLTGDIIQVLVELMSI
jgi:hypothetical protein